ncbi:sulfatase-like hydrolase/transferase [Rhodopirellula europaea]|uniref:sulfatase-like hydrolase/transferase n=1 Tax=Rhodopirellula europaea TaxID=1263866 RepID=UPI003D291974|tara:strand:- start:22609 stop:24564 length:1956 start_codon:yes stop_codon:yes gene_type:complete
MWQVAIRRFQASRVPMMVALLLTATPLFQTVEAGDRPNILWLSAEDISPHIGCYGDPHAVTPRIDQLAKEGIRYSNAFTTAGVCAPCRSGIITGMYQTTLGTQHMRCQAKLPKSIRPFSTYLREAGYFCTNNSKQDYQFATPKGAWDQSSNKAHWRNRPDQDTPFFAVFNFTGCHESGIENKAKYKAVTEGLSESERQNASELSTFPPYYPDTPAAREDWKRNYELITALDHWVAGLLDQLHADGLDEDTIVFFWSDHGVGLPRAKRWLYDSGTHIPLVIRIPAKFRSNGKAAGVVDDRLVSSIDFGPTVLNLAGLDVPEPMQGKPFLTSPLSKLEAVDRDYVYGARDRMDERYDIIRMVRDQRYKYIRNYEPLKPYFQYMNTPEKGQTMRSIREAEQAGTLPQAAMPFFRGTKPTEELYDLENDPHELRNLASSSDYTEVLHRMRAAHEQWVTRTKDLGLIPEPILAERANELGSQYAVLRQSDDSELANRVAASALAASEGPGALPEMRAALDDRDSAVRYWGATGIGNVFASGEIDKLPYLMDLQERLADESATVRVAAARVLCHSGNPEATDKALAVLAETLADGAQWERLQAAIVLDEIDEKALPVMDSMREALKPKRKLYADGKYTVRVINRALNELNGTNHTVK